VGDVGGGGFMARVISSNNNGLGSCCVGEVMTGCGRCKEEASEERSFDPDTDEEGNRASAANVEFV